MQIPPVDVILSWPTPNYDHPETRGLTLLILMVIFTVLVLLSCLGRFYSRIIVKRWFGWDDGFIIIALLFTIAMNVVVILANRRYSWDRHIWDVRLTALQDANIAAFTAKLLFVGAASFTRISLICFYYRLVKNSGITWFNKVLHASMFFVVGLGIAFTCVGIWLCDPVEAYWVFPLIEGHKCMNEGTSTLIIGIFNCIADLLCTLLPIPLVWKLKMPAKHRTGVCILLGLGFIVTIAGIIRTYFIWQSLINSWDETWYSYPLWICAAIEIDLAVICACAPSLKPLLHQPILTFTSKVSSKFSRASSAHESPMASQNHTNPSHQGSSPSHHAKSSSKPSSSSSLFKMPFFTRHGLLPSTITNTTQDSIWDGDEEYGMLPPSRLVEKTHTSSNSNSSSKSRVIISTHPASRSPTWPIPEPDEAILLSPHPHHHSPATTTVSTPAPAVPTPTTTGGGGGGGGGGGRKPTLEIMKSSCVDQEFSYIGERRRDGDDEDDDSFMLEQEGRKDYWRPG